MQLTLHYTHNLNPRVAVSVARYLDSPLDYVRSDPMGRDKDALRPFNPNTRAPILIEDGVGLWETDAITLRLSVLARSGFWPTDHLTETIRWLSWSGQHFANAGGTVIFERVTKPTFSDDPPDAAVVDGALADFRGFAEVLDATLATRDWLVGDRLTYADFRVATPLPYAGAAGLPLDDFPNVRRWHDRLLEIDAWREPFAGIA